MLDRLTVFFCHAPQDRSLAVELADFLERGCAGLETIVEEGEIRPGENLISKAADGFQADIVVVILSPDSVPAPWVREEWEPVLRPDPQQAGAGVAIVLHRDCRFPPLLGRSHFFNLTENRLDGFRSLKQWILHHRPIASELFFAPSQHPRFEGRERECEILRSSLEDVPGLAAIVAPPGFGKTTLALEFAWRRRHDFDGIFWLHCGHLSAARLAGELASQVGLPLEGETRSNQKELRRVLSQRRCLVVLDDLMDEVLPPIAGRKASILITTERPDPPGTRIALEPLSPPFSRSRIDSAVAGTGESGRRLLAAMSACPPSGFSLALAAEAAGMDEAAARNASEDLVSRGIATALGSDPPRYCLHHMVREAVEPGPEQRRFYAKAVAGSAPGSALVRLADFEQALRWTLSQPEDDPEAWSLACALGRRAIALTKPQGRFAEVDEFLVILFEAAQRREDRRVLEECAWERQWILERWDRPEEARVLEQFRLVACQDQMSFEFISDQPAPAGPVSSPAGSR